MAYADIFLMSDREQVLHELEDAVNRIREQAKPELIPEVGMNIAYALPGARMPEEVAAVTGRIVRVGNSVHPVGGIAFGASDHVARIVLTAMKFNPEVRSAANIRFSDDFITIMDEELLEIRSFDRTKEPPGVRTMDWGVASCCKDGVPDVIFDRGAMGKEPMIRILGEDPYIVSQNILKLSQRII